MTIALETALALERATFDGDHPITAYADGSPIEGPFWTRQAGVVLRPACFPRPVSNMRITAEITASTVPAKIAVRAWSQSSSLTFGSGWVIPGTKTFDVDLVVTGGTLPAGIVELTLIWEFRFEEGQPYQALTTTGPVRIYVTVNEPLGPPPYDEALELACGYLNGAANPALAVCNGIATDLIYDIESQSGDDPLDLYFGDGAGDCVNHADLMVLLCNALGLDAEKMFWWGEAADGSFAIYITRSNDEVTIRMDAPANDEVRRDAHFKFHATVLVSGQHHYDPSYGRAGMFFVTETAADAVFYFGPDPPIGETNPPYWQCGHL